MEASIKMRQIYFFGGGRGKGKKGRGRRWGENNRITFVRRNVEIYLDVAIWGKKEGWGGALDPIFRG